MTPLAADTSLLDHALSPPASMGERGDVVILLSADGNPMGTANRTRVHTRDTQLHLAFSTYLFDDNGRLLLTRRALSKTTWPGVWTNSVCGHPRPGESFAHAIERRCHDEIGATPTQLATLLPDYRYRAVDASGIVENEICPVFFGIIDSDQVRPDPAEVAEVFWVSWSDAVHLATTTPAMLSPWAVDEIRQIAALRELPPEARPYLTP